MAEDYSSRKVAILLSTFNGERFLREQLQSILAQTHREWVLYWRDDGSTDRTVALMRDFMSGPGAGRTVAREDCRRIGATHSFLRLLHAAIRNGAEALAFADQDDVWLPEKLALGVAALARVPDPTPALYCARQILVDEGLRRLGLSSNPSRLPGFPGALTQNIATGCTVMLNRAAADLVGSSQAPAATLHDWWCYLLIAAAGGQLLVDETPVILYRQHRGNSVGAPFSAPRRAVAALRRGPDKFMNVMRQHVAALMDQCELLPEPARQQLLAISRALEGDLSKRIAALRMPGFRRQTWSETMLFRLWFISG